MTVNELIDWLNECGDENFRNAASVQIINDSRTDLSWGCLDINAFDVKRGVNGIEIHIDPPYEVIDEDEEDDENSDS